METAIGPKAVGVDVDFGGESITQDGEEFLVAASRFSVEVNHAWQGRRNRSVTIIE